MGEKILWVAKLILYNKCTTGSIISINLSFYYRAMLNERKKENIGIKTERLVNGIDSIVSKVNQDSYRHFIFDKAVKNINWKRVGTFNKWW